MGGTFVHVIILGGTGLLGLASARRLRAFGHAVTLVGRRPPAQPPEGCRFVAADLDEITPSALQDLIAGHDALVYALGPDDRTRTPRDATGFFQTHLTDRTARAVAAGRRAGVAAAVVLGSYFSTWARTHPEVAARHPYVQARNDQARAAVAAGGDTVRVCVLEIPWVFGATRGVVPHWKGILYEPLRRLPVLPCPRGGTTTVTVDTLAEAVVAALERGRHDGRYPVGDEDLRLCEIIETITSELGTRTRLLPLPVSLAVPGLRAYGAALCLAGHGTGLDPRWLLRDVLGPEVFVDTAGTRAELGLARRDARAAIRASVRAAYPARFPGEPTPDATTGP